MKGKYATAAKHVERNLELAAVYAAYQKALIAAKQYDFSDMIMYVAQALEKDAELLSVLQDAYEYFLIDEHQDTNDAQNKIIELLAGEDGAAARGAKSAGPNLFVVGDEKQAIFRFQGASLENFHYFRERYKNVKLISLRNNYRSTQAILNAAQSVSPRETELEAKAKHATAQSKKSEAPAHLAALSTPDVEYFFIARKIKELLNGEGTAGATGKADTVLPEEIAVLYRDNKDVTPLVRMLEREKIPFNIESDQDVLGDEEIKKLVRILRAVQAIGQTNGLDVALAEALHVDFLGIPPIDVYKLTSFTAKQRGAIKLYDVLRSPSLLKEAGVESSEACQKFSYNLSEWKRAAENRGAAVTFEMIVRDSGFLTSILNHPSATEKLAKLHALFDLLKSFIERRKNYTLTDFFEYLDLMQEHGVAVKSTDTLRLAGRVRLMTAHRAKGLEFEYVFIMNAVDRKWGSRFHRESIKLPKAIYRGVQAAEAALSTAADDEGDEESAANNARDDADERNVFYVALTRAKKELFVTLAKTDREGKEQLPTQFIAELKPEILTPYDTTAYEKDFAAHRAEIEFGAGSAGAEKAGAKKPELKDKQFLNELFDAQGISVTALNNYLECPWAYFYRNLVRIPEAPNKHLSFGNAVHEALDSYFDAFDAGDDKGKTYLVKRFEEAIAHEPIVKDEYEEALEKGRKALPAFYDAYHADWLAFKAGGGHASNEARVDGVTVSDGTKINGKLDRIETVGAAAGTGGKAGSAGDSVRVLDYKTGKPKTRNDIEGNTKSSDGNYKRQLVFYKLLLDKEGKRNMTVGVIQFVEPDDRGKSHREEFEIQPGEVKVLEKQIEQVASEIRDLAFWNKGCNEPDCKYCELRKGML